MDGPGVRTIAELAAASSIHKPFVIEGQGFKKLAHCKDEVGDEGQIVRRWSFEDLPCADVAADAVMVHTLTGFADLISANRDQHVLTHLAVIVLDHARVVLISKIEGDPPTRAVLATARFEELIKGGPGGVIPSRSIEFGFGYWLDPPSFNIALQCLFAETDERARVLEIVGSLKSEGVTAYEDDGVSQGVVASAGVRLGRVVKVPNPVTLIPWRTFREIEQPESKFVLRVKGEPDEVPEIALFEADGGAWRLLAIERIAAFLRSRVPPEVVVVA
jgi:hypothetical protein